MARLGCVVQIVLSLLKTLSTYGAVAFQREEQLKRTLMIVNIISGGHNLKNLIGAAWKTLNFLDPLSCFFLWPENIFFSYDENSKRGLS